MLMKSEYTIFRPIHWRQDYILIVNKEGSLKKLLLPFRVKQQTTQIIFIVDAVRSTKESKILYLIKGRAYNHSLFIIVTYPLHF